MITKTDGLTLRGSVNDLTGDENKDTKTNSKSTSYIDDWKGVCPSCNKIQAPQSIDAIAIKNGGVCQICQFIQNCSDDSADIQVAPSEQSTADQILNDAIATMVERGKSYDKNGNDKERSMPQIVAAFEAVTGIKLTPEQGNKFMVIVKLVRSEQGEDKPDNYIDGAAYMALAGEAAMEGVTHE